jgi:hypothetical protein
MTITGQASGSTLGRYEVFTTSDGGHAPDFWVDDIMAQIIHVSTSAPPGIREQALAYTGQIRAVLDAGIRNAIASDHTTLIVHLRKAGMNEAAELIQAIRS